MVICLESGIGRDCSVEGMMRFDRLLIHESHVDGMPSRRFDDRLG